MVGRYDIWSPPGPKAHRHPLRVRWGQARVTTRHSTRLHGTVCELAAWRRQSERRFYAIDPSRVRRPEARHRSAHITWLLSREQQTNAFRHMSTRRVRTKPSYDKTPSWNETRFKVNYFPLTVNVVTDGSTIHDVFYYFIKPHKSHNVYAAV